MVPVAEEAIPRRCRPRSRQACGGRIRQQPSPGAGRTNATDRTLSVAIPSWRPRDRPVVKTADLVAVGVLLVEEASAAAGAEPLALSLGLVHCQPWLARPEIIDRLL
jgi:hypothetical protein